MTELEFIKSAKISDELKKKIIVNTSSVILNRTSGSDKIYIKLYHLFTWIDTKEGFDFWNKLQEQLESEDV